MKERLFIQFNGQEPVSCQLLDSNGQPAAGRYHGGLADLTAFTENRQVIVLVPSDSILYFQPEVPRTATSRLRQAIPYLLEDNLLQAVEHYHFALGARNAEGRLPVAAIPDQLIAAWQSQLQEAGIRPFAMVPEVLCLPWQEGDWTLYLQAQQVLIRNGHNQASVCEWDNLSLVLGGLAKQGLPDRVRVYSEKDSGLEARLESARKELPEADANPEWSMHSAGLFELCMHNYSASESINLLQGPYKYRRELNRQLGPWRLAASLFAGLLLLWSLDYGLSYWRLSRELHWLDTQITAEIHEGFPEIKTVLQPLNQVNAALAKLRGQAGSSLFSKLMTAMGQAMQASPGTVQEIHYRNDKLVVEMHFADLQGVNGFEQALKSQSGIDVKVLSANKKDAAVEARVQISGGGS